MEKIQQEIEKIEILQSKAINSLAQNLNDATFMYCGKIASGILMLIQHQENIEINNFNNIIDVEKVMRERYDMLNISNLFRDLNFFIYLRDIAVNYTFEIRPFERNELQIEIRLNNMIDSFKNYISTHHQPKNTQDIFFNENNAPLPTCIKHVKINNYQGIKEIILSDIPVDSQFIVLTGDNGEGKTSILQAIAIGMYGNYDEPSNLILCDRHNTRILLEARYNEEIVTNTFGGFESPFSDIKKNLNLIAYGASRLQLQSAESQDVKSLRKSNVYGIFRADNILLNIEYWFKIQQLKQENKRINAVKKLLISLMPSITDIKIDIHNTDRFVTYIENDRLLKSEELSAGNRSILAMVGDMIIRLFEAQPKTIAPKQLYGTVLIDEIEAHLHPKWQKEFPKLLATHFPLVQFIISTHSPIIFLGLPKNTTFFNISRDENKQTNVKKLNIDIENILPNQILTSALFDMENIRNVHSKGIETLSVETEPEIKARKKSEQALKMVSNGFKFQLPQE